MPTLRQIFREECRGTAVRQIGRFLIVVGAADAREGVVDAGIGMHRRALGAEPMAAMILDCASGGQNWSFSAM